MIGVFLGCSRPSSLSAICMFVVIEKPTNLEDSQNASLKPFRVLLASGWTILELLGLLGLSFKLLAPLRASLSRHGNTFWQNSHAIPRQRGFESNVGGSKHEK